MNESVNHFADRVGLIVAVVLIVALGLVVWDRSAPPPVPKYMTETEARHKVNDYFASFCEGNRRRIDQYKPPVVKTISIVNSGPGWGFTYVRKDDPRKSIRVTWDVTFDEGNLSIDE